MKRKAAVAGAFYAGSSGALKEHVVSLMPAEARRRKAVAAICPHAGLIYSGPVAGLVYASMEQPATYVLMGPNHTGLGKAVAMMAEGEWEIPTANIEIDSALAGAIAGNAPMVSMDEAAHLHEHSLEVQLPFIAEAAPGAKIVPITIMDASVAELVDLGRAVAMAVKDADYPVVIVASSDMSHFITEKKARELDQHAIDRVLALDPEGLYDVVLQEGITMCGFMPTVAVLSAALELGASEAELLRYSTSAEVSGDYDRVVGYAGVVIS